MSFRDKSEGYTGELRWGAGQPSPSHDINVHMQHAAERMELFNAIAEDIFKDVSFPVEVWSASVKTPESVVRKLWDRTTTYPGQADKITDYLRTKAIVPEDSQGLKHLGKAMEALATHSLTSAYKDQYWKPNPETGFRSFKALIDVDGHQAEFLLEYGGMTETNKFTEQLRKFERVLRAAELDMPNRCIERTQNVSSSKTITKLASHAESMIETIRTLRSQCHAHAAAKCGLEKLMDPDLREKQPLFEPIDLQSAFANAIQGSRFGRGLGAIHERCMGTMAKHLRLN